MTDRERFERLLLDWKIPYRTDGSGIDLVPEDRRYEEGFDAKVYGYWGFICEWNFDQDGNFVNVGIWE